MKIDRQYFHILLDQAMDMTKEGESFVGIFVNKIIDGMMNVEVARKVLKDDKKEI